MITGFNTNVRYGGRVFHVQTEDSGKKHPHVISHLYHGGTILASEKVDYAPLLGSGDDVAVVKALMEHQHKSMLDRLKSGGFDPVIAERLDGNPLEAPTTQPGFDQEAAEPPPEKAPAAPAGAAAGRTFGDGIVSDKPLDEVILEYLVKKSRTRKPGGAGPGRKSGTEK